jgi:hypothetical protein
VTVADLETMDRAALVAVWSEVFGSPAPKSMGRNFLRRFLAFEIQARRRGGLPKSVVTALERDSGSVPRAHSPAMKPGGRLIREWNGVTHVIDVMDDRFVWKDARYRSLSAIAREITGAHWSGPRFFGLNGKTGS